MTDAGNLPEMGKATPPPVSRKPPRLALSETPEGVLRIELAGNDWVRLTRAAGSPELMVHVSGQVAKLGDHGQRVDARVSNAALAFAHAMQPRDPAELLLLTQMAAVHNATMMLARRLNHVENIPQQDAAERALNKLARTYTAQMGTLKHYRSKGQQTVRVERVTVADGGQAIVGAVQTGGRGHGGK